MGYVYIKSEPGLWTVGYHQPGGKFVPESDHESKEEAAARARELNGGDSPTVTSQPTGLSLSKREWFAGLAMQGLLANKDFYLFIAGGELNMNLSVVARNALELADALLEKLGQ